MPLLSSSYAPSRIFKNAHFSTIYPNVFRNVMVQNQQRERIELEDTDFIDLDWSNATKQNSPKLAITVHGLEGNAQRPYMQGIANHFNQHGWDVAAINLRNCSGTSNRLFRSYHAGASDDLELVIDHIIAKYSYSTIVLCGFSLGGNILLKYLGERSEIPDQIKASIGISVPCDLYNSLTAINKSSNFIYKYRFLRNLKGKLLEKQRQFPDQLSIGAIQSCRSLIAIDNLYTSIAHGFDNAMDYYQKCSSLQFLASIKVPTLIINAKNDTFLGDLCYPVEQAKNTPNLYLEIPEHGGHVGFYDFGNIYYHEMRILQFLSRNL